MALATGDLNIVFNSKEKRLAFGVYPEVSLAEAREKRQGARKMLAGGIDPADAKQEKKRLAQLNAENTFEAIAREWHQKEISRWTPQYGANILHRLEVDIFARIHPCLMWSYGAKRMVRSGAKKAASKTKYTCPASAANAWAKPETRLVCGDCDEPMEAEPGEGD